MGLSNLEALVAMSKDIRKSAGTMGTGQARFLVDLYYSLQEYRKRLKSQRRALESSGEPVQVLEWFASLTAELERSAQKTLDHFSGNHPDGQWARSITGIGPVIAAGLIAHIDVTTTKTAGGVWRFCGLDPSNKWHSREEAREIVQTVRQAFPDSKKPTTEALAHIAERINRKLEIVSRYVPPGKKQPTWDSVTNGVTRRPWNADVKRLCWLIGESFVKFSGNKNDHYGQHYIERKVLEMSRNRQGLFAEQARARAVLWKSKGLTTSDAYRWNAGCFTADAAEEILMEPDGKRRLELFAERVGEPGSGVPMLAPAHIHERSKRVAVKLFLAHLHLDMYRRHFGEDPPAPYPIAILGHSDYIPPPNEDLSGAMPKPKKKKKKKGRKMD